MRRAAKVDANQTEIVQALRNIGAVVQSLAAVGNGCPDLLVGYRNRLFLLELKDGNKPPSAQALTPHQVEWHRVWQGHVVVVNSVESAIAAINNPTLARGVLCFRALKNRPKAVITPTDTQNPAHHT